MLRLSHRHVAPSPADSRGKYHRITDRPPSGTATIGESVPGAMVCAPQDVARCVWLPVAHRPILSLRSGCSCEPVIYFHLAVLARSLKENPMAIVVAREAREERREAGETERRRDGEREREGGKVNACTKARLCIGIKDVQRLPFVVASLLLLLFPLGSIVSSDTHRQHSLQRVAYLTALHLIDAKMSEGKREPDADDTSHAFLPANRKCTLIQPSVARHRSGRLPLDEKDPARGFARLTVICVQDSTRRPRGNASRARAVLEERTFPLALLPSNGSWRSLKRCSDFSQRTLTRGGPHRDVEASGDEHRSDNVLVRNESAAGKARGKRVRVIVCLCAYLARASFERASDSCNGAVPG